MELYLVVPECFLPFRGGFADLQNATALGEKRVALRSGVAVGSGGDAVSSKLENRGDMPLCRCVWLRCCVSKWHMAF